MAEKQIFRQQSLDKLSSPERLDQLLRIVRPQSWILLLGLGVGACLVVVWSIFGLVPETVQGSGVLVLPKQLTDFHSPADGQIASVEVSPGTVVGKGDVLATLAQPTLHKELEVAQRRLALVMQLGGRMTEEERVLAEEERASIAERSQLLADRIDAEETAAEKYRERNLMLLTEQQARWRNSRSSYEEIRRDLETEMELLQGLVAKEYVSEVSLMEPRRDLAEINMRLANLNVEEQALIARESEIMENYELRLNLVEDLKLQRNDLKVRELEIRRRLMVDEQRNARDLEEVTAEIDRLQTRLASESQLTSEHEGKVMEIHVAVGHQVSAGQVLGRMEIDDPDAELKAIAYFPIGDGKKIREGLEISISPATVERQRFGGMVGVVESVSRYPVTIDAAELQVGDRELARQLLGGGVRIEVGVRLEHDPMSSTTYRWTSGIGPPDGLPPTPGTTADVRVTLEERAPITLVLPFLKNLIGQ